MKIYEKLKLKREALKFSRKTVAEKLFVSKELINEIENGRTRLSLEMFIKLCNIYNIPPMEFLNNNEDSNHYILVDDEDIKELNRIVNKINNQILPQKEDPNIQNSFNNFNSNNSTISFGNNVNIKNSFRKK